MKRRLLFATLAAAVAVTLGCATLEEKQRDWIFQPSDQAWGTTADAAQGMQSIWIPFHSQVTGEDATLHALWLAADRHPETGPVLLYLHGARWNVEASAPRIRRMQQLGFSVLAIDYRGFGKSTRGLPSEDTAYEDARVAWAWLAAHHKDRARYVFGHSLGGAIAIDLASRVHDEQGVIVEGTFTSMPDMASESKWGWLPLRALITQRFDSLKKITQLHAPLLVVHGSDDATVPSALGRRLYDAAKVRKEFLLVDGGTHFSTMARGEDQYREAIAQFFRMK